ncbi:redoxin domain-containing protein [Muriicola jejuensis]|uniref:Redoxin domain-containing protein n=1 Tax=Muriicola jejuensis TaxID=504488 RepID=A0A6P0U9B9_9FLAO|nr:redoxin domain-containing protein [Muriicola jejuensis]
MKKKTVLNILLILVVLSFFVTPLGYHSKILLNRLFAGSPDIIPREERIAIADYDWTLKDEDWNFFSFDRSRGKVVFINFWASWRLPSAAELKSVENLYERFKGKVDFYIITDEEREPVKEFMEKNDFIFPVTYLIIGETAPFPVPEPPATYILDKEGRMVVKRQGIGDWDSSKVIDLIEKLLE